MIRTGGKCDGGKAIDKYNGMEVAEDTIKGLMRCN